MGTSDKRLEAYLKDLRNGGQEKVDERLNMLCDGVFAIAITLLVLDIRLEVHDGNIIAALQALSDKVIIYIITFVVVAGYWNGHRRLMKVVKRMDTRFVQLTLLFLAFVTFFPVASNMIMDAGGYVQVVIIYTLVIASCGFSTSLLWWYAIRKHRLVDADLDLTIIRYRTIVGLVVPVTACLSLLLLFFFGNHPLLREYPQRIFYSWLIMPLISRIILMIYRHHEKKQAEEQQDRELTEAQQHEPSKSEAQQHEPSKPESNEQASSQKSTRA